MAKHRWWWSSQGSGKCEVIALDEVGIGLAEAAGWVAAQALEALHHGAVLVAAEHLEGRHKRWKTTITNRGFNRLPQKAAPGDVEANDRLAIQHHVPVAVHWSGIDPERLGSSIQQ
jgi:hypothetical protein